ncbi:AraC family transcriptional regulator [Shouchella shacheensis]|uniref:AraC family transcriptional regulator n=1 Tax=Shouchella shacheensis TaxID=1649580 RepID=UPI00073FBE13|nr:AraC family transcriptional regulator [Shouchella shacheensis]
MDTQLSRQALKKKFDDTKEGFIHVSHHQTKKPEEELPNHLHDWNEIIYIHQGTGTLLIDQQLYTVAPGDLFVIPGNTVHRAMPKENNLITSTVIFFHPRVFAHSLEPELNIIRQARGHKSYHYQLQGEHDQQFERFLGLLRRENTRELEGKAQAIASWVQLCLLEIWRHARSVDGKEEQMMSTSLNRILSFIDAHLHEELSLRELAKREAVSAAHFSRLFKKEIGLNLSDYLLTKRISLAKGLLVESDESIEGIAERCGFRSMPHFYRSFKKMTDMTPRSYRTQYI